MNVEFWMEKEMSDNIILDKSFEFAIRVVKLYKYLCDDKKEYVLSKVKTSMENKWIIQN